MTTASYSAWSRRTCAGTGVKETGREGPPAESVLRCAVLKQHRQLSSQELAFHLEDSTSFRAFARLPWS
jgi:IS5 family transposase